jgi:hypothetical protein
MGLIEYIYKNGGTLDDYLKKLIEIEETREWDEFFYTKESALAVQKQKLKQELETIQRKLRELQ